MRSRSAGSARARLDVPSVDTQLRRGVAAVTVRVRVRNRTAPRTLRVAGTLGGAPLRFGAVRLERGRAAWVTARVSVANPRLWGPGHPELYELRLAVPGEPGYQARVGLRELRRGWRPAAPQRPPRAPPGRVAAGGRARPRRCDDDRRHGQADRATAGDRREHDARAAPARARVDGAPRPCRHPRLAGRGPVRRAGSLGRADGGDARADRPPRASRRALQPAAPEHRRLEPRQRGQGQRDPPRAAHLRRARRRGRPRARRRPPDRGRRLGHPPADRSRDDLPRRRRRRRHQLRGLVRRTVAATGGGRRAHPRLDAPAARNCSRTRSSPSPSSAPRPTRSTPTARPAGWAFRPTCSPATSARTRPIPTSPGCWPGHCRTSRCARTSSAGPCAPMPPRCACAAASIRRACSPTTAARSRPRPGVVKRLFDGLNVRAPSRAPCAGSRSRRRTRRG